MTELQHINLHDTEGDPQAELFAGRLVDRGEIYIEGDGDAYLVLETELRKYDRKQVVIIVMEGAERP